MKGPTQERVEALLALVADDESRQALQRVQEALASDQRPSDEDLEAFNDLWETFGDDLEAEGESV